MRIYLGVSFIFLSFSISACLECRPGVSEEHCAHLHEKYQDLYEASKRAKGRPRINPLLFRALHMELARMATLIGKVVPGSTQEQMDRYASLFGNVDLEGEVYRKAYRADHTETEDDQYRSDAAKPEDLSQTSTVMESGPESVNETQYAKFYGTHLDDDTYVNDTDKLNDATPAGELHGHLRELRISAQEKDAESEPSGMSCDSAVTKEVCDTLQKKYKAMKEVYGDADLMGMLNPDAYTELHREMEEAGIHVEGHKEKTPGYSQMTCDSIVQQEDCDALLKKYKVMKEIYGDANLKDMLNPDAYNELHRKIKAAGIQIKGGMKKEMGYTEMTCGATIKKEDCDILLKKYKVMKEMYGDADLKEMLNPDAYNELRREMEEAGIQVEGSMKMDKSSEIRCNSAVTKDVCETLMKKYEVMKEMYGDADLKKMLNPNAYNELHREMEEAGIRVEGSMMKELGYSQMTCDTIVAKEECDSLLKKYKVMKEMYGDADLMEMLNPNAYTELHRDMEDAGIPVEGSMKKEMGYSDVTCDSTCTKEECDSLLKKYKVIKEINGDADLMKMLNPDVYNELLQEMEEAGIQIEGSMKKKMKADSAKSCHESVSNETCETLLKKYKIMKDMYSDIDLKEMLDPNAYNDLHREMVEAGIEVEEKKLMETNSYPENKCNESVSKETCEALLKKYKVMKEMYSDKDLKQILAPNACNDLYREMVEAGIEVKDKKHMDGEMHPYPKNKCNESVSKETCEALLKKYKLMEEMYSDADLKQMLDPSAYNNLHREMVDAGIEIEEKKNMENEMDTYPENKCNKSVSKETCEALLKKYKIMKEMYGDTDLKQMLDPNAYNDLHREMMEAGIEVKDKKHMESEMDTHPENKCNESVSDGMCEMLLKKYKTMKKMYNDVDLKEMLDPSAYNDLHREIVAAGIEVKEETINKLMEVSNGDACS